jgi:hypothetical protein
MPSSHFSLKFNLPDDVLYYFDVLSPPHALAFSFVHGDDSRVLQDYCDDLTN